METDLEKNSFNAELPDEQAMNRHSWLMMVENGYTPDQNIQLDFVFVTEERSDATRFQAFLEELDCKVKVVNNDDEFEISGKTPEMKLTFEGLNEWTEQMVERGLKYDCTFDGWTTPLVLKKGAKRSLLN